MSYDRHKQWFPKSRVAELRAIAFSITLLFTTVMADFSYPDPAAKFRRLPMDIQKELIAEYDRELVSTRKMLDAIPADADLSWKASSKSMTLGRLAGSCRGNGRGRGASTRYPKTA